jgi:hypothetical protein
MLETLDLRHQRPRRQLMVQQPHADYRGWQIIPVHPLPSNHRNRFGGSLGGIMTPSFAGGKTYFFVNYEGRRFPNVS